MDGIGGFSRVFEARDLACIRGERAIFAGLSFALAPGGALLLTGANGAGKSTLLRVVAGLAKPTAGSNMAAADDIVFIVIA